MFWLRVNDIVRRKTSELIQRVRIYFYQFISTCHIIGRPIRNQPVQCVGLGCIEFEGQVNFGVFPSPFFYNGYCYLEARNSNAKISFGNGTWINNNFVAISDHKSITIGNNVLIGTFVEIYDSNFHGLEPDKRGFNPPDASSPVVIEDNVFLGSNVIILKGVTIGRNSVIANGSIVTKSIPPDVVAGGNPAKVLKQL
jgi:acetyltransferase-like isoleucine patch superfamily enzyme